MAEELHKKRRFTLRSFLFRWKAHPWEDPEVSSEAQARANEIKALRHQARVLEHEKNVVKEQYKLDKLRDEIEFYKEERNPPQNNQGQDLMQLLPLLALMGKKEPIEPGDFMQLLGGQNQNPLPTYGKNIVSSSVQKTLTPIKEEALSDEEIMDILKQIPAKQIKMAKAFPDELIRSYVKKNFDFNDSTIDRVIQIVRAQK